MDNKVRITVLSLLSICFLPAGNLFGQGAFTATWALTADQTVVNAGVAAASITSAPQLLTGLVVAASSAYQASGQRTAPGSGGGPWPAESASNAGRYAQYTVSPAAGFSISTISKIQLDVSNEGTSSNGVSIQYSLDGTTFFTVTADFAMVNSSTPASKTYTTAPLPLSLAAGQTFYLRILPWTTAANASGKYLKERNIIITGTTAACAAPTINTTTPGSRCGTGTVSLAATASAGTLNWWDATTGGINIGTGSPVTTPSIAATTTYYVDAVNGGCASARTAVVATVNAAPTITGTTPGGSCGTGTVSLAATASAGTLNWWDAPTGGTNIGTGSPVTTPSISSTTTYYVDATFSGCTTASRTAVTATVNNTYPTITGTTPGGTCGTGTVSLAATASAGTLSWWDAPTGGTNIGNGSPVTTPSIAATTTYYVAATYLGCTTVSRTAVTATFNAVPTVGTLSSPSVFQGVTSANITYAVTNSPDQYSITYSATALAQGFVNVTNQVLTSPIVLTIPAGATAQAYTANSITVSNSVTGCTSTAATFTVTVTTAPPIAYYWVGGAAGNFTDQTSWSTAGVGGAAVGASGSMAFNSGSVLIFDGTDISAAAGLQTGSISTTNGPISVGQIIERNNATVTLNGNSASNFSFTIGDVAAGTTTNGYTTADADISIPVGCVLNTTISGAGTMTVALVTAATAAINGTMNVNNGTVYNTNTAGAVTTLSGRLNCYASVVSTAAARLVVPSGGIYNHGVNGGTIPTSTWNSNSTCLVTGSTGTQNFSGHKQTFSKFVWDCAGQTHFFVLGENSSSSAPNMVITDSFIVKRTNGQILQITSSGGQKDFTCGNYFQYGGLVAVTYKTNDAGGQRSLTVNNTFYVTDSLASDASFQIINNPSAENTDGRLFVKGNVEMHKTISSAILEKIGTSSNAEIWFTGAANQFAKFNIISDSINFVTAQTSAGFNVTLGSDAKARQLRLAQGTFNIASNTLTVDREVSYPAPATGLIGGSSTSNLTLTMNGAAGTLNFASASATLKNFTQLANNSISLGTALAITAGASSGRDSIGSGATLTTNDNLILRSDINGTARMAKLTATATVVGKVTVERYLPMNLNYDSRRWRLLTAPFKTTNAPTINAAWQEGVSNSDRTAPVNPKPGYGTQITKSTTYNSDGYDQGSTNNPSIYYYSGGTWAAPANTNSVKITDNSGCYMLFARGDRSIVISNQFVAAAPTTLEPKGELNIGNVTVPLTASGYQTVGNPYASEIKLDNINFNDTAGNKKTIYLWDPKTLGSFNVGKFITCSGDGASPATYTYTGNTSTYNSKPGVIESSGAFMVKGNGGNIVFHESDKTMESNTIGIASRPASPPAGSFGKIRKLYTDLLVLRNGAAVLADGVANTYNKNYKNSVDYFDAPKLTSFTSKEELSIKKDNQLFAIERRKSVKKADTIFLNISKLNQAAYLFGFRPFDFDHTYSACIEDQFLHTATPFSLNQPSTFTFSITADPASAATGRFYIIFRKAATPKNINLKAVLSNDDIALDWKDSDEGDAEPPSVERSTDGVHFTAVDTTGSVNGIAKEIPGEWLDKNPLPGIYYYRVRFTNGANETLYSNVAKVTKPVTASAPAIFPNPVTDGRLSLSMGPLPEGTYTIKIINSTGQLVYSGNIIHQNRYTTEKIELDNKNAKGLYRLEIISGNKTVTILNMMMQ